MSSTTWGKFYWADWSNDPKLKLCSLAARGLWMQMLCIASESIPVGYVAVGKIALDNAAIAKLSAASLDEVNDLVAELERNDVFSRTSKGTIYCRRMISDAKKSQTARENGKNGGNPSLRKIKENQASDKGADNIASGIMPDARYQKDVFNSQERDLHQDLASPAEPPKPPVQPAKRIAKPRPRKDDRFERFWSAYPRRVKRPDAEKAFAKAIKRAPEDAILAGVERYKKSKPDYADWAHPASWLNNDRWLDQYDMPPGPGLVIGSADPGWRVMLELFCKTGNWSWAKTSPEPGQPGCKIPPTIIAEYADRLPKNPFAARAPGSTLPLPKCGKSSDAPAQFPQKSDERAA